MSDSDLRMKAADGEVLRELETEGPLSHDDLCERLGIHWDDLQSSIRRLRTKNKVSLTIDRRYSLTDSDQS